MMPDYKPEHHALYLTEPEPRTTDCNDDHRCDDDEFCCEYRTKLPSKPTLECWRCRKLLPEDALECPQCGGHGGWIRRTKP